jgi:hypothetical protein
MQKGRFKMTKNFYVITNGTDVTINGTLHTFDNNKWSNEARILWAIADELGFEPACLFDGYFEEDKKPPTKIYPCDNGDCPYDAQSSMECYHLCGLGADENEMEFYEELRAEQHETF